MALEQADIDAIVEGILDADYRVYQIRGTISGDTELDEGDTLTLTFTPDESGETVASQLAAIAAKTALIGTGPQYYLQRVTGSGVQYDVDTFIGESQSITIPSANYSAVTLVAAFQNIGKEDTDIATVADGSITKTSTSVAFAPPSAVRSKVKTFKYSVRRASDNEVLIYGTWRVLDAALADS